MANPPFVEFPSDLCTASIVLSLDHAVSASKSPYTFQAQQFNWGGQAWNLSVVMPRTTNQEIAKKMFAFQLKLQGSYGSFSYSPSILARRQGVGGGAPVLFAAAAQGDATINTTGWPSNTNGVLKQGDFIQLGTGQNSRLHCVLDDVNTDANGRAIFGIAPVLRADYTINSPLEIDSPSGVFRMTSNSPTIGVQPGPVYTAQFSATENL